MAGRRLQGSRHDAEAQPAAEFVHLHVHSEFSLLDGLARISDLVERARALDMRALALTDHGVMYGAIDFYSAAKAAGIKPIVGCEIYVAPRSLTQREPKTDDKNYHLTLLARDETGYHNLLKIVSRAHLDGFYYKPRADKELLARHSAGLICLSGCMSGEVARLLLDGQAEQAKQTARWYAGVFGKEGYYLEVQNQMLDGQDALNKQIVALAHELDLPVVATNDSHYVRPEDSRAHDVLLCIQTNSAVEQSNRMRMGTQEFYLRSPAEMARAFPGLDNALQNTLRVADQVDLKLEFNRVLLPHFELPDGQTPESHLRRLCEEGLQRRYGVVTEEHRQRLSYELSVIEGTGYALYFLIVADYVRFARERGILAVPRGSVAGSIAIYALGISDIDPLRYGLMFERFLHAERLGMPDIDMDFADDRREEVIRYVQQKYGRDRVAQIITFGTMAARAAVRDVGRALGMKYGEVDRIAKAIPMGSTIAEALVTSELKTLAQEDGKVQDMLTLAQSMEGIARNASTHAAGIVISRDPLEEHVPLQKATRGEEGVITQWPFTVVEKIGMLKMDILGLANLTILERAREIIQQRHPGLTLNLQDLPMEYDDPCGQPKRTYDMLGRGDTTAVFQLESAGMRRCLKGLKPNQISDLLAILALYRPGPMESIPAFIAAKNGQTAVTYPHPDLEEILGETYGICVYQDQVLQTVRQIAGFSWGEADILRKAMGKKNVSLMAEQREKFLSRTLQRGYGQAFAEKLWSILAPFAGYGFPKGHAAAYAVVSYQTAFLKANYPSEYMAAVLTSEAGNPVKVAEAVGECRRLGVEVRPPDVNRSRLGFSLEDGPGGAAIRFGLSGVKNVGHNAIERLLSVHEQDGVFRDLSDFCRRVDLRQLNKRALESLIKAGATDSFGERAALLAGLDAAMGAAQQHQRAQQDGQTSLFDLLGAAAVPAAAAGSAGSPDTSAATGVSWDRSDLSLPNVNPAERKQRLAWEKEMIGLYISEHPLAAVAGALAAAVSCSSSELVEEMAGQTATVGGFIAAVRLIPTKKGDLMAAVELEDLSGSVEVIVFPRSYQAHRELLTENTIVLVRGKVDTRDDRPKILSESIELFDPPVDSTAPSASRSEDSAWPANAPGAETGSSPSIGEQTGYPLGEAEAQAVDLADVWGNADRSFAASRATPLATAPGAPLAASQTSRAATLLLSESPARPAEAGVTSTEVVDDGEPAHGETAMARDARATNEADKQVEDGPMEDGTSGDDGFLLELTVERSTSDERDVNRLMRLYELLDRFPGRNRVVLRFLTHGRGIIALELIDGVRCCGELVREAAKEVGDHGVRLRTTRAPALEVGERELVGSD